MEGVGVPEEGGGWGSLKRVGWGRRLGSMKREGREGGGVPEEEGGGGF